ncbi:hypothetical protein N7453_011247 [Penicillium expansum]|nr:hypothetical protein N7453_011247 [Penicillium expansum]
MARPIVPAFLRDNAVYNRLLRDGATGELSLPYPLCDTRKLGLQLGHDGVMAAWAPRGQKKGTLEAAIC